VQYIDSVLGFFVVESKDRDVKLDDHVPQVLTQLYAAAKKLKSVPIVISDSTDLMIGQESSYTGNIDKRL
jgi:hypothetical protein